MPGALLRCCVGMQGFTVTCIGKGAELRVGFRAADRVVLFKQGNVAPVPAFGLVKIAHPPDVFVGVREMGSDDALITSSPDPPAKPDGLEVRMHAVGILLFG